MVCGEKARGDRNRRLMLKFKYGTITRRELDSFHELVKNIIYKAMHRNPTMANFEDLYHDIWLKIIRFKNTWNQNKNTYVSTWITIVANSVINTTRKKIGRRRKTEWLYDDICGCRRGCFDETADGSAADFLAFENDPEQNADSEGWWSAYAEIKTALDEDDREMLDKIEEYSGELAVATPRRRRKITRRIASELGWTEAYVIDRMAALQKTFARLMGDGDEPDV